jgi:hypothetical protein
MLLNVGLDVSFDNMQDWKVIREKVGEVNNKVKISYPCNRPGRPIGL